MTYRGFLAELLMAECDDRARRRSERRIKAAGFLREKSLRAFDVDIDPNIDSAAIHTFASCERPRRPPHLQRHHHRNRHRLPPPRQHPSTSRRTCQGRLIHWKPIRSNGASARG
jgi:hypothetical protein